MGAVVLLPEKCYNIGTYGGKSMKRYLARKIDAFLVEWKADKNKKPLLIKGARQIGKTEAVRHFATAHYRYFHEINFVLRPEFKQIVEDGYSVAAIIKRISFIEPEWRFEAGHTLLFFDEIQEFPEIATSLKSFAQDAPFDVIASGSMLGIQYKRISSHSMGYKTEYDMYSLDFEEFLAAKGYGARFVDGIYGHIAESEPFDSLEMKTFSGVFRDFCVLGGMPEIVEKYIVSGTFEGTLSLQREIVTGIRDDIRKYAEGLDQTRIANVFEHVPAQLAKENKKFQISKVAPGARFRDYRGCVEWLRDAGVVVPCYCMTFPSLPLKGNYDGEKFKLYMADTGILVAMLDDAAQNDLRANRNFGMFKGALYENIVGEAFMKSGLGLFYYKRENATLEQDFFVRTAKSLVPVEVKGDRGVGRSMRQLVGSDRYPDIRWGIKLHGGNVGFEGHVLSIPTFCAFLVNRMLADEAALCRFEQ